MITIRPFEEIPSDEASQAVARINASNENWSRYNRAVLNPIANTITLLAEREGKLIGYAVAELIDGPRKEALLPYLAVDKSSQSAGAGTKLLEGLIERVQVAGFSALNLSCRESVLPFYESFTKNHEVELSKEENGTYFNGDKKFELCYTFPKEKRGSCSLN